MANRTLVSEQRKYLVLNVQAARKIARVWLERAHLENVVGFGLPEVDDRYHIWRVPLINNASQEKVGEVAIDAYTSLILEDKSTSPEILEARLLGRTEKTRKTQGRSKGTYVLSSLRNTIAQGDAEEILQELPAESVNLIFTSPSMT